MESQRIFKLRMLPIDAVKYDTIADTDLLTLAMLTSSTSVTDTADTTVTDRITTDQGRSQKFILVGKIFTARVTVLYT